MASSLQHAAFCTQAKIPASSRLSRPTQKPINLSFSATFPSLNLTTTAPSRRSFAAKMSATAAASYASALADLANSNNTLDSTSTDVEKIDQLFTDPQVLSFFLNPTIDAEKKKSVIEEFAKTEKFQPHTANFMNILVESNRIELMKDIVKEFELVYNRITGTELAVVSSVVNLESAQMAQIAKQVQKLTGSKNVRIKTVIDPSLVAGFTIRYGGSGSKLIDMSVKKQLEEITAQLDLSDITLAV
ncbi:ATP synthase subunit delta, chloroplastic [Mercurialis annua]|uniref:ATP synthase subunit delta, chloroplastic n=1 Tax=Mercurialis annua TaxID=3986 RepID=UPI00215F1DFF|nr:ATP synthase subunit delta, chloroplastic [Mercurialis annua]